LLMFIEARVVVTLQERLHRRFEGTLPEG
jgi:hypothetical protein